MPKPIEDRISELFTRYGEMYGITRLADPPGWWVRLGWKKNLPTFQETVLDSGHGGLEAKALVAAKALRAKALRVLLSSGVVPLLDNRSRPFMPKNNCSGVAGVSKRKAYRRSGHGYYYVWKVSYSEKGKPRMATFGFTTYGGEYEAFVAAVEFRAKKEWELYGMSLIDMARISDIFRQASVTV